MRQFLSIKYFTLFFVTASIFFFLGCEKKYSGIIDNTGYAPILISASLPYNTINTDTVDNGSQRFSDYIFSLNIPITAYVSHIDGINEISDVKYSIEAERNSSIISEGILRDNGVNPDKFANDSYYSGNLSFQIERYFVGKLNIAIWSVSSSNYVSNKLILPIFIKRTNLPPVVSNLSLPDTVNRNISKLLTIKIKATDPDGQADVQSVFRVTASGRMFKLYDNGSASNGDITKGDGYYSEKIDPTPPIGQYVLRFFAIDYSGDSSNIITKQITIVE